MTTTTMHFGPEWMRTKQAPSRPNPSPPLATPAAGSAPPGASSYSALVAPIVHPPSEKRDPTNPFRYSKDDMLRIYKEGGGKGGLGLEVERWEGIVREVGSDPISMKELNEAEKKIFSSPLNSEMRRRPSTDYMSLSTAGLGERPKLNHANTGGSSPMRERIGGFMGRRRDSADPPQLTLPRKLSQSSLQPPLASPRDVLTSPRTRIGGASGFDGVLSDSWSVKRRASEGILKGPPRSGDTPEGVNEAKAEGIKEEEEEERPQPKVGGGAAKDVSKADPPPASPAVGRAQQPQPARDPGSSGGVPALSLNTRVQNQSVTGVAVGTPVEQAPTGPPPGLIEANTVEWQYLDPQGQIQGPFPAATMQKWYDDGYFTPGLPMRRVNIDKDWIPVSDLLQIAGTSRIFLTPLNIPPPGFPRRDPLLDGPSSGFSSPFQPTPNRSLLDTYQHGNVAPDSPASGFGAARYSSESPDPTIFGGRLASHLYNEPAVGSRIAPFISPQHGLEPQRRVTMDDTLEPSLSRPPYAGFAPGRTNSIDGLGFNTATGSTDSAGPFTPGFPSALTDAGFSEKTAFGGPRVGTSGGHMTTPSFGSTDYGSQAFVNGREGPRLLNRDVFADRAEPQTNLAGQYINGAGLGYQQTSQGFAAGQPMPYIPQSDTRSVHSIPSIPERQNGGTPVESRSQQAFSSPSQSPWPPQEAPIRRPGPFDPDYPTTRNTVTHRVITPSQVVQQPRPPAPPPVPVPAPAPAPVSSATSDQSSWFIASHGVVSNAWASDPNSLTAANLGQHNRQQEQEELQKKQQKHAQPVPVSASPATLEQAPAHLEPAAKPEAIPGLVHGASEHQPPQKARRKPSIPVTTAPPAANQAAQAQVAKSAVSPPAPAKPPSPTHASPWGIDDDKKTKPPAPALGLREIQEIEAKKLEARRATEREKEKAARAAAASQSSSEEVQTISWGLPTSQVGARATPATKDTPTLSPSLASQPNTPAPVWTGVPKAVVVKKTMKEIQEEEEKRKKMAAKEKETVASAARRAHADTAHKNTLPAQPGGVWTTVGASGKAASASITPARPSAVNTVPTKVAPLPAATTPSVTPVVSRNGNTVASRPPAVSAAVKHAPTPKVDDTPVPPSHDFLKWLADALKGLNNSVNMEEITSMLLSFPLDPDSSTLELISDLIYANSTTLDGRRFASEFVSKRKADAKSPATNGPSKPLSIADVVKAQPKPAQNEWGGFKVVNKKKKGSRS